MTASRHAVQGEDANHDNVINLPVEPYPRPKTRGDCECAERPCVYVGCRHNLYLDVGKGGHIKFNYPGIEPQEMTESCSLDVADEVAQTTDHMLTTLQVATVMNVARQRVDQLEETAVKRKVWLPVVREMREL